MRHGLALAVERGLPPSLSLIGVSRRLVAPVSSTSGISPAPSRDAAGKAQWPIDIWWISVFYHGRWRNLAHMGKSVGGRGRKSGMLVPLDLPAGEITGTQNESEGTMAATIFTFRQNTLVSAPAPRDARG
jgi:hypothetical protein